MCPCARAHCCVCACHVTAGQPIRKIPTCSGRTVVQRERMTGFEHVLNFLSVFVSLYFRIAFSGSECRLLSFLCALSRLLCSFPIMLCFQPLCCLVSFFFFFLSNAFPWPLTHFLLSRAFPPALRFAQDRAIKRRFPFPLPVYSISNYAQLATERLHVPVSLILVCGLVFFFSCSLLDQISLFFFPCFAHLLQNFHCHDFKEKQTILILRWKWPSLRL